MLEGPVKKRKTSHGAATVSKSHMKTIPGIAKLSKKSKKEVPVQSEEEEENKGDEEKEEEEVIVVGDMAEVSENAPESTAVEPVVKSFKELVSSFLTLMDNSC